jgi:hypothetical protein
MCRLDDIHYVEFREMNDLVVIYEVDDHGIPTAKLSEDIRRDTFFLSPIGKAFSLLSDCWHGLWPYVCMCGFSFKDWSEVLEHLGLAECSECTAIRGEYEIKAWEGRCYDCRDEEDEVEAS